jgi:hypothetical protein
MREAREPRIVLARFVLGHDFPPQVTIHCRSRSRGGTASRLDGFKLNAQLKLGSLELAAKPCPGTVFSYAHPIFWAPFTLIGDGGGAAH